MYQFIRRDTSGQDIDILNVESIKVIPEEGRLLFILPECVDDADFKKIQAALQEHFGIHRKILTVRGGDLRVFASEEPKDETNG